MAARKGGLFALSRPPAAAVEEDDDDEEPVGALALDAAARLRDEFDAEPEH